jgi:hypothetical protein
MQTRLALFLLSLCLCLSCGPDGAPNARKLLREKHASEVKALVLDDVKRHLVGVARAGERVGRGFQVELPAERESQMRTALRLLTKPPRGIHELIASARTFTAAIDTTGVVIATDAKKESDRMTGVNLGAKFAVVRDALAGKTSYAIDEFPAVEKDAEGSVSLLFAAPSTRDGAVVGAVLTGIPLWRLSQRLSKQQQLDHVSEQGAILWVYVYRGDKLHHFGTPPDLDTVVPDAAVRKAGLKRSPGGFTGEVLQFGRWYAWAVLPLRVLGDDTGLVLFRSDPI